MYTQMPDYDHRDGTEFADTIVPSAGNTGPFMINGFGGDDNLQGANDNDFIFGGEGDDFIFGGLGFDNLHGGAGDDVIRGGGGQDFINPGDGADVIVFARNDHDTGGSDRVVEFTTSEDTFDFIFGSPKVTVEHHFEAPWMEFSHIIELTWEVQKGPSGVYEEQTINVHADEMLTEANFMSSVGQDVLVDFI